jgi:hypothetical protein
VFYALQKKRKLITRATAGLVLVPALVMGDTIRQEVRPVTKTTSNFR